MTLTIDAGQLALSKRDAIASTPLVVLETFTDRAAGTVDKTFNWSRGFPCVVTWATSDVRTFLPVVQRISPVEFGFDHIPNAGSFDTRQAVSITLENSVRGTRTLWETLVAENIIGARVTIAVVLFELADGSGSIRPWDISGKGTGPQTIIFRGEVTDVPDVVDLESVFTIVAETEEVPIALPGIETATAVSPEAIGARWPLVVGQATDVRCPRVTYPAAARLTAAMSAIQTTLEVDDNSVFAFTRDSTPVLQIGSEYMKYLYVDPNGTTISGITRATNRVGGAAGTGSTPATHAVGDTVNEAMTNVPYALSGTSCLELSRCYYLRADGSKKFVVGQMVNGDALDVTGAMRAEVVLAQEDDPTAGEAPTEVFVDVQGAYELGTPAVLVTLNGDSASWSGGLTYFVNDGTGILCVNTGATTILQAIRTISSTDTDQDEIEITINIAQGEIDQLVNLVASVGGHQITILPAGLSAGDNVIRFGGNIWNPVTGIGSSSATTQIGVFCFFDTSAVHQIKIDGTIDAIPTTVSGSHPTDAIAFLLDVFIDDNQTNTDATSFSAAKTLTPGLTFNGDISGGLRTFAEVLARASFESRINFHLSEAASGTVVLAKAANTSGAFGSSTRSLTPFTDLTAASPQLPDIVNDFVVFYGFLGGDPGDPAQYSRKAIVSGLSNDLVAEVADADLSTSRGKYGTRPSEPIAFQLLKDLQSVERVAGYYVNESLRIPKRYSAVVPWWVAFDLELGDIVDILPRWLSSAQKVRITRKVFDFDRIAIGLNLEEVV